MTEVGCGTGRCKTENKGDVSEKSMPLASPFLANMKIPLIHS